MPIPAWLREKTGLNQPLEGQNNNNQYQRPPQHITFTTGPNGEQIETDHTLIGYAARAKQELEAIINESKPETVGNSTGLTTEQLKGALPGTISGSKTGGKVGRPTEAAADYSINKNRSRSEQ